MEDNNRKGPGIFYAVVGVATLVVAIIGATFAYFSASAEAQGDSITGKTNSELANALSLNITKVTYSGATAANNDLVPTNLKADSPSNLSVALGAKCESDGYTACHVYKIDAKSTQTVKNVNVKLETLTTGATVKGDWKYVIYTGSENAATALIDGGAGSMNLSTAFDMHKNGEMTANTTYTYYLVIYLADDGAAQNKADANDATGTYTGTVSMSAMGGEVSANFNYS